MRFIYRPDLVEQALFLMTRCDAERECEVHARTDRLYAISDAETRDAAFRGAYSELFREWEIGRPMEETLASLLPCTGISRCVLAPAARRSQQRIDLLGKQEAGGILHTLFVQLTPESLVEPAPLNGWLRRELLQVNDMLDPAFGYQADDLPEPVWERKLFQDRYMMLWKMYVESRLCRAGLGDDKQITALRAAFAKGFRCHGSDPTAEIFEQLMEQSTLSHAMLRDLALDPGRIVGHAASTSGKPTPGAVCPICGFPTHDWFDVAGDDRSESVARVQAARATWTPKQGICRQCAETYASRGKHTTQKKHGGAGGTAHDEIQKTCVVS